MYTDHNAPSPCPALAPPPAQPVSSGPLTATIAVDTDAEFYNLFGNAQDAANYVALLVACEWTACHTAASTSLSDIVAKQP